MVIGHTGTIIHKQGQAIKSKGSGIVEGYLISWGTPQDADLEGQYFTPNTDLGLNWFNGNYPVLYHHGLDNTLGIKVIGRITAVKTDDVGLWVRAQLNLADTYAREVYDMVQTKQFGWSSGSIDHLVKVAPDGHIKRWVLVEGSITPTPAQPRKTTVRAFKSILPANSPLHRYLEGDERKANPYATYGLDLSNDNNTMEGFNMASSATKRQVRQALKRYGVKATPDEIEAVASELEDEAVMGYDEDATMGYLADDEDDAMMGYLADDEDEAMMGYLADDEDEATMGYLMDDEDATMGYDEPAVDSYARKQYRRMMKQNRRLQKRIKSLEMSTAPYEDVRGVKAVLGNIQVTDVADRQGAYKSAFWNYLRSGSNNMSPTEQYVLRKGQERAEGGFAGKSVKSLTIGNSGSFAYAVPEDFIEELNRNIMVTAQTANECRRVNTTRDSIVQPDLQTTDARRAYVGRARWVGETPASQAEHQTTDMQLSQIRIPVHVLLTSTTVSLSSLEDSVFDLQQYVREQFAEQIAIEYDELIWSGDGQGKLLGITQDGRIVDNESTGVSFVSGYVKSGGATTIDADQIMRIQSHMPPQYRSTAKWYMNSNTMQLVRTLKDANGNYLWGDAQGLNQGIPTTLLSRPIVYNEFAPDPTGGQFPLVYADLSKAYTIVNRVEFSVRRFDDSKYAELDQTLILGRARIGGQPTLPPAIKVLKMTS
jgi:HK97 family phage major capsid protein